MQPLDTLRFKQSQLPRLKSIRFKYLRQIQDFEARDYEELTEIIVRLCHHIDTLHSSPTVIVKMREREELQDELRNLRITERRIEHLVALVLAEIHHNQRPTRKGARK